VAEETGVKITVIQGGIQLESIKSQLSNGKQKLAAGPETSPKIASSEMPRSN
jgi:hypothetical protein